MKYIYLMRSEEDGRLFSKLRNDKYTFLHRSIKNAKPGFFRVDEIQERGRVRIVKGENITTITEIHNVEEFLLRNPKTTGIRKIRMIDGSFALLAVSFLNPGYLIIDENNIENVDSFPIRSITDYFFLDYETYEAVYVNEIDTFRANLGLKFPVDTDKIFYKPKEGEDSRKIIHYANISRHITGRGNIPLVVNGPGYHSPTVLRAIIWHNKDVLSYWKHQGLSKLSNKEAIDEVVSVFRKHPQWDSI